MQTFKQGDAVTTPSGRKGTIEIPPGSELMPAHALVSFEAQGQRPADKVWTLANILKKDTEA